MGLLHELVNLRRITDTVAGGGVDPVRHRGHQWIHETKADIVENGLYGVDIQQQAVEICRLRLWLSIVVDYDLGIDPFEADTVTFREAMLRISQLPNLEMNFRRGDSLLDMISGVPVRVASQQSQVYREEYERIHKLGLGFHRAIDSGGKSIHAWLRINLPDRAAWDKLVRYELYGETGRLTRLGADRACCNPARLSRLPGHYRRDTAEAPGRWQRLLYLNPDA